MNEGSVGIVDLRQLQAVRRGGKTELQTAMGFEGLQESVGVPASQPDLHKRTRNDANHIV